jgi:chromosome segregation ATPase
MIAAYNEKIEQIKKEFDDSANRKNEQLRESELLKDQCTKQQTSAITNEAIKEAQFKKRQLEGYLEEATLKQRLEIMEKYRQINLEMCEKINAAREEKGRIRARAGVVEQYDQRYKQAMDEFHNALNIYKVEFEHYKKNIQKTQKKVTTLENKMKGNEGSLADMRREEEGLKNDLRDLEKQNDILLKIISELKPA